MTAYHVLAQAAFDVDRGVEVELTKRCPASSKRLLVVHGADRDRVECERRRRDAADGA